MIDPHWIWYKVGEPGVPNLATATRLYERDLLAGHLRGYKRFHVRGVLKSSWHGPDDGSDGLLHTFCRLEV